MKRFNNFVEEYKQQRKEAKKAKLQKKYEVKPFSEEYTALNGVSFYSSFLLQVLSLVTAVTLIAYWVKVACNSWVVGFITGGIIFPYWNYSNAFWSVRRYKGLYNLIAM